MDARSISWIAVSLFENWCENRECDLGSRTRLNRKSSRTCADGRGTVAQRASTLRAPPDVDGLGVGSKNSAELELEVVLSTAVAAARPPTSQPLEFTHLAAEAGRFSFARPSFQCNSCSSPAIFCWPPSLAGLTNASCRSSSSRIKSPIRRRINSAR